MKCGCYARLKVAKFVDFGVYLCDEAGKGEVLLPRRYVPAELQIGEKLEVFLYTDSEDRLIATTLKPLAKLGEIAALRVVSVAMQGCYLDMGIPKDLFMPCKEPARFCVEDLVVVWIDLDREGRLIARLGIKERLKSAPQSLKAHTEVEVLPFEHSSLGYGCVVNGRYFGMLFNNEVFAKLALGNRYRAYVKAIRSDGKIDLRLRKSQESGGLASEVATLLRVLKEAGGSLMLHYDSAPKEIVEHTGLSKKGFKRALTCALKEGKIKLLNTKKTQNSGNPTPYGIALQH